MKAGSELDALIAEKVMGWKKGELNWTIDELWIESKGSYKWVGKFSPSTNISDAYQVVEKLHENESIYFILETGEQLAYDCTISDSIRSYRSEAETAPLAICLSALRAKGVIEG